MKSTITIATHNNVRYLCTKFFSYDITGRFIKVDVRRSLINIDGKDFRLTTEGRIIGL